MKNFFLFTAILFVNSSISQSFEEISLFVENNKFFDESLIASSRDLVSINSLDSIHNYDNYDKIRFDYTLLNHKLKLYVFKMSDLLIITFHKLDSSILYSEYLILNKKKNLYYLVSPYYYPQEDDRLLFGINNINTITEVDKNFKPLHKHYIDKGEIHITSNFIYFKERWFEELGVLQKKVSIGSYSTNRAFGEMSIPAFSDLFLVFQRELNYDSYYPFWFANKYLETIYYELPNSSMNKHHPSSFPSTTKKQLNNPVKMMD
jgi:hypothetical protein